MSSPPLANARVPRTLAAVPLLTDLDAFSLEHRRCGDLDGGVDGEIVWFACSCEASMARRVDEGYALARGD
jgi:hypothetical protein